MGDRAQRASRSRVEQPHDVGLAAPCRPGSAIAWPPLAAMSATTFLACASRDAVVDRDLVAACLAATPRRLRADAAGAAGDQKYAGHPLIAPPVRPLHEIAPHHEGEDQHRQHDHGAAGGDAAPFPAFVVHEVHHRDRRGHRLGAGQDQGEEEVVPGEQEAEDGGGGEARPGERQDDAVEALPHRGAVDPGGLLQRARQLVVERPHHPDHQRQVEGEVDDDEAGQRVEQLEVPVDQEVGDGEGDRRRHAAGQDPQRDACRRRASSSATARRRPARRSAATARSRPTLTIRLLAKELRNSEVHSAA